MQYVMFGAMVLSFVALGGCDKAAPTKDAVVGSGPQVGRWQMHAAPGGTVGSILLDTTTGDTWALTPVPDLGKAAGMVQVGGKAIVWVPLPKMGRSASTPD